MLVINDFYRYFNLAKKLTPAMPIYLNLSNHYITNQQNFYRFIMFCDIMNALIVLFGVAVRLQSLKHDNTSLQSCYNNLTALAKSKILALKRTLNHNYKNSNYTEGKNVNRKDSSPCSIRQYRSV